MTDLEKKDEILKAAGHCFAHFGFTKTTMDDIGRSVGLNKASLYYYYKNKEAIFSEIIEVEGKNFLEFLKDEIKKHKAWDEKIQAYFDERQRYFRRTLTLHSLSIQAAQQFRFQPMFQKLAALFQTRETKILAKILDRAVQTGQIPPVDTRRTARILLSVVSGFKKDQLEAWNPTMEIDPSEYTAIQEDVRFTLDLILKGLAI